MSVHLELSSQPNLEISFHVILKAPKVGGINDKQVLYLSIAPWKNKKITDDHLKQNVSFWRNIFCMAHVS